MRHKARFIRFCLLLMLLMLPGFPFAPAAARAAAAGQAAAPADLWTSLLYALQAAQKNFDTEITGLMTSFQHNAQAGWWLIAISFLYGVLHAAGPGHGKAVISSYLIANNETLKRGIVLAFWSSLLQALTAIILVGLIFAIFTGRQAQQAATRDLEIIGSALIMLLGLRLLIRKSSALLKGKPAGPDHGHGHGHGHNEKTHKAHSHHHGKTEDCSCSGHIAAPDRLKSMDWKQALPLIFSVGIRPCTGALVVMGFALMNGLFALGAAAVLAMSFGTFLIVSALAYIAVNAKKLALRLSTGQSGKLRLQNILEWAAAFFIFLSGLILLLASLY